MFGRKKEDKILKKHKAILSHLAEETQNYKVMNHLINYDHITTFQAYETYGITRLGSRINDLRNMGADIECEMIYKGKKHFGKYRLGCSK